MKKPIAKLREDVVKAAMARYAHSEKPSSGYSSVRYQLRLARLEDKACAALASRQKRSKK